MLIAYTLVLGRVPFNQGSLLRSREPAVYWRWLRRFVVLLAVAVGVLCGTYFLDPG